MDDNRIDVEETKEPKLTEGKSLNTALLIFAFVLTALVASMLTFSLTARYLFLSPSKDDWKSKADVLKRYIEDYSYFEPNKEVMEDAALKAYVYASGDPYSEYYNEEDLKALSESDFGRYVGIGVSVSTADIVYNGEVMRLCEITRVFDGSPAQEAGIRVGDLMYSIYIDGEEILSLDIGLDAFAYMIQGEEGTFVSLSVLRKNGDNYEKIDVVSERRAVVSKSVTFEISPFASDVGVVNITQFDLNTPVLLEEAFDYLNDNHIKNVVIDLRGNGGGDRYSIVACASYFLNEGDVIMTSEDIFGYREVYEARPRKLSYKYSACSVSASDIGKYRDFEIVVLINSRTASAAELFAAVFRDYKLAVIVGTTTYGKGTMQTIFPLDLEGMSGGLKITTDIYFPPCGENYEGVGVAPDIVIKDDKTQVDNQLEEAIKIIKE